MAIKPAPAIKASLEFWLLDSAPFALNTLAACKGLALLTWLFAWLLVCVAAFAIGFSMA